jgi:hypothetical protein
LGGRRDICYCSLHPPQAPSHQHSSANRHPNRPKANQRAALRLANAHAVADSDDATMRNPSRKCGRLVSGLNDSRYFAEPGRPHQAAASPPRAVPRRRHTHQAACAPIHTSTPLPPQLPPQLDLVGEVAGEAVVGVMVVTLGGRRDICYCSLHPPQAPSQQHSSANRHPNRPEANQRAALRLANAHAVADSDDATMRNPSRKCGRLVSGLNDSRYFAEPGRSHQAAASPPRAVPRRRHTHQSRVCPNPHVDPTASPAASPTRSSWGGSW